MSGRSVLGWFLELALISAGVFLALLADQWRESREHQRLAAAALRNFAEEIRVNQKALTEVRDYHERLTQDIETFLAADGPKTMERFQSNAHFRGIEPVFFEHTRWDLALAGQALSYIDPQLAYAISRVYTRQQTFETFEKNFALASFSPNTFLNDDTTALARAVRIYLADVNNQEPALLKLYEKLLPQITGAPEARSDADGSR